jgi:hypothetical protein
MTGDLSIRPSAPCLPPLAGVLVKKALPLVLLGAALLLFCVGLAALGANFVIARGDKVDLTLWKPPLDQVEVKRLTAANSLEVLADVNDAQAIDDALQQGDWESAFAGIAYSPGLTDANRIGTLLLLGSRYAMAKQTSKAAWCYQYATMLAQISPQPSDLVRIQTLLEVAQGLHGLQLDVASRAALDQAYLIAEYSTTLPRDARARLLAQIAELYKTSGAANLATQAQQKSDEAASLQGEKQIGEAHPPFRILTGNLPPDQELADKTKARVTAAKELIDALNLHPPKSDKELPQDLIQTLGAKLNDEDGTRQAYYDAQLKSATDPALQAALLRDKISWLALKLRVARGAFGLSLVAAWEPDATKIATELSDTFDEFYKLTEQQATATNKTVDADRQLEDVLRAELVSGRWGLYTYDENDLRSRLGDVSNKLRDDQVPTLRLDSFQRANLTYYLLVPDELYGQGEKALPR